MLSRALDLAAAVGVEVVLSCRRESAPDPELYRGREVRLVFDDRDAGPLAGLEVSLAAARFEEAIVFPVDMPGLAAGTLARLAGEGLARPEARAVVYSAGGSRLVFPAFYRRSALADVRAQLDAGRLRVVELLDRLEACVVEADAAAIAGGEFRNVNSEADLAGF